MMEVSTAPRIRGVLEERVGSRVAVQLAWLVGGLALSVAIPFLGSDVLELPLPLYYLLYFALVLAFLGAYVRWTSPRWFVGVGA